MNMLNDRALITIKEQIPPEDYPFSGDLPLVYLGELANLPEHGIFIGKSGKCYWGYHIGIFRELTEDEL